MGDVIGSARGGHPRFYEIINEQADLHSRKNHDYAAGGKQGPLGNFQRVADIMALWPGMDWSTPFGVAIAYMLKQLDAAMMLASQHRESVTGEPIPARLNDVAVYTNIARIIWEERNLPKTMPGGSGGAAGAPGLYDLKWPPGVPS